MRTTNEQNVERNVERGTERNVERGTERNVLAGTKRLNRRTIIKAVKYSMSELGFSGVYWFMGTYWGDSMDPREFIHPLNALASFLAKRTVYSSWRAMEILLAHGFSERSIHNFNSDFYRCMVSGYYRACPPHSVGQAVARWLAWRGCHDDNYHISVL